MEFVSVAKLTSGKVTNNNFSFETLRKLDRIRVDHHAKLIEEPDNVERFQSYVDQGLGVVPIVKIHPHPFEERADFPARVLLELTSYCNMKCRMCPRHDLKRPDLHMTVETAKRVIDELDHYGIEGLWLYHLGESLMHPQLSQIFDYIHTKQHLGYIWFSTNGHMLTDKNIDLLLDSPVTHLNYSLHTTREDVFQTVSPTGDYALVRKNLFALVDKMAHVSQKPILHLQMIHQESTASDTDQFLKDFHPIADIVSINMLEFANLPNNTFGQTQRSRGTLQSCKRIKRGDCFILSDGDVEPCDAAYNWELSLGNISKQSLHSIWNGELRKKLLALNTTGKLNEMPHCSNCTDYDL